jgi:hypothetical protein
MSCPFVITPIEFARAALLNSFLHTGIVTTLGPRCTRSRLVPARSGFFVDEARFEARLAAAQAEVHACNHVS